MKNKKWIYNKTVIVSGASSGIGRGIAKTLIERYNCHVIGIGRNEEKMISLKQELGINSDNFEYSLFDVSSLQNWQSFYFDLEKINKSADVLINCAGQLPPFKRFDKCSVEEIENVMNVNFYSAIYSIKTFLPMLLKSNCGAIINVCSMASLTPLAGIGGYTASKGALKNLTETLQQDYKKKLYIGAIYPGFTKTNIFRMQSQNSESKLINMFSTSCEKMVKKCVKGIVKKRKRMVFGFDCKIMNFLYKFMPNKSISMFTSIMKKTKIKMFEEIFND